MGYGWYVMYIFIYYLHATFLSIHRDKFNQHQLIWYALSLFWAIIIVLLASKFMKAVIAFTGCIIGGLFGLGLFSALLKQEDKECWFVQNDKYFMITIPVLIGIPIGLLTYKYLNLGLVLTTSFIGAHFIVNFVHALKIKTTENITELRKNDTYATCILFSLIILWIIGARIQWSKFQHEKSKKILKKGVTIKL